MTPDFRICAIMLDEKSLVTRNKIVEQEREVAIEDLLHANHFRPAGSAGGPYHVRLGIEENRLVLAISHEDGAPDGRVVLPLIRFRRIVRDYFLVCDSYYKAIRTAPPQQVESLDMGRKTLHDEGAALLQKLLEASVETDFDTARRVFTLICVLHMKS